MQAGDVVVLGTDGLFDNVFPDMISRHVAESKRNGESPAVAAASLASFARERAEDSEWLSPFAVGARAAGYNFLGGKMDDITCVIAYVSPPAKL